MKFIVQRILGILGLKMIREQTYLNLVQGRRINQEINHVPYFTKKSISWLDKYITSNMKILEYGGGGSSLWWCKKAKIVHTVEASIPWCILLLENFKNNPELLKKWRLHMSPCEWNPTREHLKSYWINFKKYLTESDQEEMELDYIIDLPKQFDVIVIDGSIRYKTLEKTQQILQQYGEKVFCIVVDNTENEKLSNAAAAIMPNDFHRLDFPASDEDQIPSHQNGKWITSIWVNSLKYKVT